MLPMYQRSLLERPGDADRLEQAYRVCGAILAVAKSTPKDQWQRLLYPYHLQGTKLRAYGWDIQKHPEIADAFRAASLSPALPFLAFGTKRTAELMRGMRGFFSSRSRLGAQIVLMPEEGTGSNTVLPNPARIIKANWDTLLHEFIHYSDWANGHNIPKEIMRSFSPRHKKNVGYMAGQTRTQKAATNAWMDQHRGAWPGVAAHDKLGYASIPDTKQQHFDNPAEFQAYFLSQVSWTTENLQNFRDLVAKRSYTAAPLINAELRQSFQDFRGELRRRTGNQSELLMHNYPVATKQRYLRRLYSVYTEYQAALKQLLQELAAPKPKPPRLPKQRPLFKRNHPALLRSESMDKPISNDAADAKNIRPYPKKPGVYGDLENGKPSTPQRDVRTKPEVPDSISADSDCSSILYPSFYGAGIDGRTKHRTLDGPLSAMKDILARGRMAFMQEPKLGDLDDSGTIQIPYGMHDPDGGGLAPIKGKHIRFSWVKVAPDGYIVNAYSGSSDAPPLGAPVSVA